MNPDTWPVQYTAWVLLIVRDWLLTVNEEEEEHFAFSRSIRVHKLVEFHIQAATDVIKKVLAQICLAT